MEAFLLVPIKHGLVNCLSEEALPKSTDHILGVSLIQNLNEIFQL